MGVACAMVFCAIGAGYGTAKSAVGITHAALLRPDMMINLCIPIVMAGIVGIYGLVISVMIHDKINPVMSLYQGFMHLSSGLAVGLSGLAAGFAIGIVGDAGVRGASQQPRLYIGMASAAAL
ncbi:H(+)-transporting V0 sector ATPase subunit c [Tulasnella sp. 427]|nr:H(+)-transporting V0 sector ATPase subunit c [Tulasnella sp. 427]